MTRLLNFSGLCRKLRQLRENKVVGIEGFMGSGKSFLAKRISEELNGMVVDTDDFLIPTDLKVSKTPYSERLNYARLQSILYKATASGELVQISGICLRDILSRILVVPELFVYIKKYEGNNLWQDGSHLEDYEACELNLQSKVIEPNKSVLHYHSQTRPQLQADIFFHLRNDSK